MYNCLLYISNSNIKKQNSYMYIINHASPLYNVNLWQYMSASSSGTSDHALQSSTIHFAGTWQIVYTQGKSKRMLFIVFGQSYECGNVWFRQHCLRLTELYSARLSGGLRRSRNIIHSNHCGAQVLGSIPSQGPCHTKDVIEMVPVVLLFGTQH